MIDQKFVLRARMTGTALWVCPECGQVNTTAMGVTNVWATCCTTYALGLVFYPVLKLRGRHVQRKLPVDCTIPRRIIAPPGHRPLLETLPEGDPAWVDWKRADPVHVLVNPGSANYTPQIFVRNVRLAAQAVAGGAIGDSAGGWTGLNEREALGVGFELVAGMLD